MNFYSLAESKLICLHSGLTYSRCTLKYIVKLTFWVSTNWHTEFAGKVCIISFHCVYFSCLYVPFVCILVCLFLNNLVPCLHSNCRILCKFEPNLWQRLAQKRQFRIVWSTGLITRSTKSDFRNFVENIYFSWTLSCQLYECMLLKKDFALSTVCSL